MLRVSYFGVYCLVVVYCYCVSVCGCVWLLVLGRVASIVVACFSCLCGWFGVCLVY